MNEYTEDKCFIKTSEWTSFTGEVKYDNESLSLTSCKNIGCHRGMVQRGLQIYPSGTCLMGLLTNKKRVKDNEIIIKPNPDYL